MKRLFIALAAAWFVMAADAQTDMPRNQTAQSADLSYTKKITLRYLLYKPKEYGEEKKKWPLVVFLHGAGERGTNLAAVAVHGPPKLVKEGKDFPFVLISPQCASGDRWQPEAVMALVDEAIQKYDIDAERVYLTGLSMGGFGSWALATMYPERFAAVVPICGGGNVIDVLLPAKSKEAALKSLPIWAFHGGKDPVVKLEESERMVEAFKRAGNSTVKLTVYPEAQHDSWTQAYNEPDLFKWMLEQKRPQTKKTAGR
jgi:predicted peptidase